MKTFFRGYVNLFFKYDLKYKDLKILSECIHLFNVMQVLNR